ncbi:MAG: SurA N-terminal domain-containing protein [Synergistales bacterium]|nr:SurA N-terminal domain-containing protein [Synergistales bacterium]MDY6401418.1 SurA N-terminal domain-containing protein [Synergistales bacterium]MDY6404933.1 SurA N-terminal domain-containing protein [Synergistales bacterium]MDY6410370.1 SurA N-terminal domain-containing protein [Synergistales bacterium]MDY6422072.1 SurA N-terminal domain-containing protein [Synergistales bacterium]
MLDFLRKQMKWVMAIVVVAFLLSTFFMYEGGTRRKPTRNADGTMSDYEVAQINGRSFMRSELEQRLRSYLGTFSSRNTASLDMPALYQTVLNQAVLESQLLKEIDEQGIRVSDAEAEEAMKNYADTYYPTRETFYQALDQSGIKVEDYKRNLARQIAVDRLMNNAVGEINISEDKAVEFYDSMKELFFTKPEGFMVHMADFKTSADAEAFREKLVGGASWDVIASDDNVNSGDVINITKEPVFLPSNALRLGTFSALASLDISEPSEVLNVSSFDFAVVMKTSSVDKVVRPYDEVSGDIRNLLTQEEQRVRLAKYNETLTAKANLVINDKELFERPAVSDDTKAEPEVTLEDISGDVTPEKPEAVDEVKEEAKSEEIKSEEQKSEDTPAPVEAPAEVKAEEVKEEAAHEEPAKSEEAPKVSEAVEEVKDEPKPEETKPEEIKSDEQKSEDTPAPVETPAEVKAEEVKEEAAHEEPAKSEEAPKVSEAVEEVKDEPKSEDVKAEIISEDND